MHILIAITGTSQAEVAMHLGRLLHLILGGKITILSIIKHDKDHTQAEATLIWAKTCLKSPVTEIETCIRKGHPAKQILREISSNSYDLLIIEESDHHKLKKQFFDPNVKRVLSKMPCPILIAQGEPHQVKRILVCDSGRSPSLLNRLITQFSPLLVYVDKLTVLHVMSQIAAKPGVRGWELRADAQELIREHTYEGKMLEEDLEKIEQLNASLEAKVRHGLVIDEILAEASIGDYDMVIIGAHKSEGWQRFLLENIALDLVTQISQPLLVI